MAERQLRSIAKALNRSFARLASGSRLTSALDGAAELGMASRLEAQTRGLGRVIEGVNHARSYLTTLEGFGKDLSSIIGRMEELSLQAANGTLGTNDRSLLNLEFQQLVKEYNRLVDQSTLGGQQLADGSRGSIRLQTGTTKSDFISFELPDFRSSEVFRRTVNSGVFGSRLTTSNQGNNGLAVGDLNEDDYMDIFHSTGADNGTLQIIFGRGDGTFAPAQSLATGLTTAGLTPFSDNEMGDMNGDGHLDLVTILNAAVYVQLGNGDGTFKVARTFAMPSGTSRDMDIGDINNDGKADVVVADFSISNTISIFLGNGDGTLQSRQTIAAGSNPSSIQTADFNNDGWLDMIVGAGSSNVFLGNGDGTFRIALTIAEGVSAGDVGDINNDGYVDFVGHNHTTNVQLVLLSNGDGTFQTPTTSVVSGAPRGTNLADINGDGNLDVNYASNSNPWIYYELGRGDGTFASVQTFLAGTSYMVRTADLNNDGVLDFIQQGDISGGSFTVALLGLGKEVEAVEDLDISNQASAENVLEILANARDALNLNLANIGAVSSRFDSIESVSLLTRENISSARSQMQDVDYALEMAEVTRLKILEAATVSVMRLSNLNLKLIEDLLI